MTFSQHQICLDGSIVNVVTAGAGPPVLLASGYFFDANSWAPQIEALADRYHVVVPELWGHGQSGPMPAGTGTTRDLARQHLALLDQLQIDACALVGVSLGGMWCAELAMIAPDRVSALVLMDTSLAEEPAARRHAYLNMLDLVEASSAIPPTVIDVILKQLFSRSIDVRQPGFRNRFAAMLANWDPASLKDSIVPLGRLIFGRRDALQDLAVLSAPVLVATGENDVARPPEEGRVMADIIGCDFVLIPNAGHTPTLEAPELVNQLLNNFLAKHVLAVP